MVISGQTKHCDPYGQVHCEVEAIDGLARHVVIERRRCAVNHVQRGRRFTSWDDLLVRPVPIGNEPGPQRLVTVADVVYRTCERIDVEWSRQTRGNRNVVGGLGTLELMNEPEPRLSKGQGQTLWSLERRQR